MIFLYRLLRICSASDSGLVSSFQSVCICFLFLPRYPAKTSAGAGRACEGLPSGGEASLCCERARPQASADPSVRLGPRASSPRAPRRLLKSSRVLTFVKCCPSFYWDE